MTARVYNQLEELLRACGVRLPWTMLSLDGEGLRGLLAGRRRFPVGGSTGKSMLTFDYAALELRLAAAHPELLVLDSYSDLVPGPLEPYRAPRDYGVRTTLTNETLELVR